MNNVALKCLIAPELWWLVSVCSTPPLLGSHLLSQAPLGQRSHQDIWVWRSLLLPGAAHPPEMGHPWSILPSISISLSLQMHVLVQGGSAEADQELASALSLISWCFSASLGAATSGSRSGFQGFHMLDHHMENPTIAGGKQLAGNAVAPVWISVG